LRAVHEVGRFDISGSVITVRPTMRDAPPKVFLTVIQKDGSFKAVDRL
jgi:branched-chain amino acid transport system substrate-binding protein